MVIFRQSDIDSMHALTGRETAPGVDTKVLPCGIHQSSVDGAFCKCQPGFKGRLCEHKVAPFCQGGWIHPNESDYDWMTFNLIDIKFIRQNKYLDESDDTTTIVTAHFFRRQRVIAVGKIVKCQPPPTLKLNTKLERFAEPLLRDFVHVVADQTLTRTNTLLDGTQIGIDTYEYPEGDFLIRENINPDSLVFDLSDNYGKFIISKCYLQLNSSSIPLENTQKAH